VAARSSSTTEDLEGASFAGPHETILNVSDDAVLDAIRWCWASMFDPRATTYREQCGIDHFAADMAVVIQQMIQSERSGIAFSCDPLTHDHSVIIIEAARGLGKALVSGAVTPDMYVVDKATLTVLDRTIVEQKQELVHGQSEHLDQTVWSDIPADVHSRPKLTDDEIVRLAGIVKRVEDFYGVPQDIDWAEAEGAFYILQSRPIAMLQHVH
jgi:pyruvate,water dikinase